ncbi:Glutathione S-transferase Mu 1, partial [Stegodyphus mimosarum]
MAPVLGYWDIRGLGQSIRFMLVYTETEFEHKKYAFGPAPEYSTDAWLKEKYTLGLDFPNLPYYIDDDVKLTQSIAIMRYLARKHKLEPETEAEKIRADLVEQQVADFRRSFGKTAYDSSFKIKKEYMKVLPDKLKEFSDYLGKRLWFASQDKITYVDFMMYEVLYRHKLIAPDCLNKFQNLKDYFDRFEKLPAIQKYMQSPDYIKWPSHGDNAVYISHS